MNIVCLLVSRHNLKTSLKCFKHVNNGIVPCKSIIRSLKSMAQKVSQNKTYVAVNIPENANHATKKKFWGFLKRDNSTKKGGAPAAPRLNKHDLLRLLSLAKPEKWRLIGAICFLLVSSTVTMSIPFSLGKVLDIIYDSSTNKDEARAKLNQVTGILVCVFILGALCNFARVYLMSVSGYRMTQALRNRVFSTIMKQEQGWFDKRSTGELVNRLSADTQLVGNALSSNISDGLRSTVMVCAGTGMMFYMSAELALVGLAIVPPVAILAVFFGRYLRGISRGVQDSLASATSVAEERIANIRTVKTFSQEPREMDSYANSIKHVLTLSYSEAKARAVFYGLTGFSGHVIIISVLYYGGVMVSSNTITVGNLSSFLLYAAYIGVSLGTFSNFYTELNKSIGAASRIWEIIDREPVIPMAGGTIPIATPEGHIQFKDIQFSYPARDDVQIFENFQLEIQPGKMVAVVGPSGSGKSTLAALLLRLYDPGRGQVFLDGQDVKDLDPSWLRRHIGTVSQEPVLFSCSIRDNILYGADDPSKVTEDDLMKVAKEANVYEFVQQLPEGFDTMVGERGVMLSGGQKQRIAIARALIKDPKILLLDEATSALDAQSERLVQEALERIMKGRTVLTIAHRLSTIQNADTIAVLKDGHIVEQGKYQELLNIKKGAFKELVKHQTFQGPVDKT
ncbi:ATP-binding cassette sub-family B member 10, mitochondrial isoform X1 [Zophobas morio]|uniref:ATP-binding cassette sub-family B member 10, mitochondrial isoform X1 n=2 Tax=Zophobas morio TaxID=2755281 RepID=UPI003083A896